MLKQYTWNIKSYFTEEVQTINIIKNNLIFFLWFHIKRNRFYYIKWMLDNLEGDEPKVNHLNPEINLRINTKLNHPFTAGTTRAIAGRGVEGRPRTSYSHWSTPWYMATATSPYTLRYSHLPYPCIFKRVTKRDHTILRKLGGFIRIHWCRILLAVISHGKTRWRFNCLMRIYWNSSSHSVVRLYNVVSRFKLWMNADTLINCRLVLP